MAEHIEEIYEFKFEADKYNNIEKFFDLDKSYITCTDKNKQQHRHSIKSFFTKDTIKTNNDSDNDYINHAYFFDNQNVPYGYTVYGYIKSDVLFNMISSSYDTQEYEDVTCITADNGSISHYSYDHASVNSISNYSHVDFVDPKNEPFYTVFSIKPSYIKHTILNTRDKKDFERINSSGDKWYEHMTLSDLNTHITEMTYDFLGNVSKNNLTVCGNGIAKIAGVVYAEPYNNDGIDIAYPECVMQISCNNDEMMDTYGYILYSDYNNINNDYYFKRYEILNPYKSVYQIGIKTSSRISWPDVYINTNREFYYGISKKFALCDQLGHIIRIRDLSNSFQNLISSMDTNIEILEKNTNLLSNSSNPIFTTYKEESLLWEMIADSELNDNGYDQPGMITYYNSNEDTAEYDYTIGNYLIDTSFPHLMMQSFSQKNSFCAVISANSIETLRENLKKIKIKHPDLQFAGFVPASYAGYSVLDSSINSTYSIFDNLSYFFPANNAMADALSISVPEFRPYHNIFVPVFFINSTILINVLGNDKYRQLFENRKNDIKYQISMLSAYSTGTTISNTKFINPNTNQLIEELSSLTIMQKHYDEISAANTDEFIKAIKNATIYSNAIYNVFVDTDDDGKVSIGNKKQVVPAFFIDFFELQQQMLNVSSQEKMQQKH